MHKDPSPREVLILWGLIAKGGEGWQKELRPKLEGKERTRLEKAELLASEKRKGSKNREAFWVEVTETGWAWANNHLDAKVSSSSKAAGPILQAWLTRLKTYMGRNGIPLADIISGAAATPQAKPSPEGKPLPLAAPPRLANGLPARVRDAYLTLSGGVFVERVRLSDLREKLPDVPRRELDETLLKMQRGGDVVLYTLDNPREITDKDSRAAIKIGGEPRHIMYMEGA